MIIKCKDISVSDGTSYHSLIDNKVADGNSYVPMQMEKFGVCHGNDYYVPYASLTVDLIPVMVYREILYDEGVLLFRSTTSVLTPFTIGLYSTDKPGAPIADGTMPDSKGDDPSRSMRISLDLIPRNTQYYIRFNGQNSNYSDGVNRYYMNVELVTVLESPEALLTNTGKVSFSRSKDLLTYNIRFDRMIETSVNIAIIDITSDEYNWIGQTVMTSLSNTFEDSIRLSDDMNGHTIKVMQYTQDAGVKTPVDSYPYESYTYVLEGNEYIVT